MSLRSWLYPCVVLLALSAGGALAQGPDDEARTRYERAVRLYEEGVYDAALVELNRAYELRPSYKLLYNIGQVRLAMRDHAAALDAFQRYLREGGERVADERREQVRAEVARLEQRVARLAIESDIAGAEVFVDDALVGTIPLAAPVLVNSGVRRVVVRHPEHPPQSRRVSIAGGEQQALSLPLGTAATQTPPAAQQGSEPARVPAPAQVARAAEATPAARAEPSHPKRSRRLERALLWSGTAALAATAVGLGIGARQRESKLKEARDRAGADPDDLQDKSDSARKLGIATDAFAAAAVVGAGVSLWLTLRGRDRRDSKVAQIGLHHDGISLRTEL